MDSSQCYTSLNFSRSLSCFESIQIRFIIWMKTISTMSFRVFVSNKCVIKSHQKYNYHAWTGWTFIEITLKCRSCLIRKNENNSPKNHPCFFAYLIKCRWGEVFASFEYVGCSRSKTFERYTKSINSRFPFITLTLSNLPHCNCIYFSICVFNYAWQRQIYSQIIIETWCKQQKMQPK